MKNVVCVRCGLEFLSERSTRLYCGKENWDSPCDFCGKNISQACSRNPIRFCCKEHKRANVQRLTQTKKNCLRCNKEMVCHPNRKFCGEKNDRGICDTCGKDFLQVCSRRHTLYCGIKCHNSNPEIIKKANKSREKLGYLSDNARDTIRKVKEKYGVDNVSQLDWVKAKKAEKLLGFARPEFRDIIKEKYGVENVSQLDWIKEKKRQSALEKYGVENVSQVPEVKEKIAESTMKNHGVISGFRTQKALKNAQGKISGRVSQVNKEWQKTLLDKTGVEFEFEQLFGEKFFADLGYGELLIDINPSVSHNATVPYAHFTQLCKEENCLTHRPKSPLDHQTRALAAEETGLILFQYFDWMNKAQFFDQVKRALGVVEKIVPLSETHTREIAHREVVSFIQRNRNGLAISKTEKLVGTFKGDELLYLQIYLPGEKEWFLKEEIPKIGVDIPGVEKSCDGFIVREFGPSAIIFREDLATPVYGMASRFEDWEGLEITEPSFRWAKLNGGGFSCLSPITDERFGFRKGEQLPPFLSSSEEVDFVDLGYAKVYDCGNRILRRSS